MAWIQLRSGTAFDFDDLEANRFPLHDIGWSLAHLARYNGHTRRFYSVAEHSLAMPAVIPLVLKQTNTVLDRLDAARLLGCVLVHDAHEAFIGDIAAPVKKHLGPEFRAFEARVERFVRGRLGFGIDEDDGVWELVRLCDRAMLAVEASELLAWPRRGARAWGFDGWDEHTAGMTLGPLAQEPALLAREYVEAVANARASLTAFVPRTEAEADAADAAE